MSKSSFYQQFVTVHGPKRTYFLMTLFVLLGVLLQAQFVLAAPQFIEMESPFLRLDVVGGNSIPSFADIDGDGDQDAFIGGIDGTINYYKNNNSSLEQESANPLDIVNVQRDSAPALVDIDNDGDQDAFIGKNEGTVSYYKNTGDFNNPFFVEQTGGDNPLNPVNVTVRSTLTFGDIDNDSDLDAIIGAGDGTLYYYENIGSTENPKFEKQTGPNNPFNNIINVGSNSVPTLGDIDKDGDLDLLIGEEDGIINYYENINTVFEERIGAYNPLNGIDVGEHSAPVLVDFDKDGTLEVFIGASDGTVKYFLNTPVPNISISPTSHNFSEAKNPNTPIIIPNDKNFYELWALQNTGQSGGKAGADIGATKAWGITTGKPVVCAVLDSGVDSDHHDLKDNMVLGWNFIDNNDNTSDNCGHGTQVAGIIGAVGNNELGITGVNWYAKIMPLVVAELKPLPDSRDVKCSASDDTIIEALKYVQEQGVKCVNISLGAASSFNKNLFDAIQAYNGLIIAAVGNDWGVDNDAIPYYPASYDLDNILSVCATDRTDGLAAFSNVGSKSVDLCAPGSDIKSTHPDDGYIDDSGTSMSTAYVSGAVSLLWSAFPTLTALEIKEHLIKSADYLPKLQYQELSAGRLNVYQAMLRVQSQQQTFTISNTGQSNLKIDQIRLTGNNISAFKIGNDDCSSQQLAPNSQPCFVKVLFDSNEPGNKEAVLEVLSNAPLVTVQLSGFLEEIKDTVGGTNTELSTLERAKPALYRVATGEVEIPTIAIPKDKGYDIYQVKLCPVNDNPLRFILCDFDLLVDRQNKFLGDTLFDASTGIVYIPGVKVGSDTGIFYEVMLQTSKNSEDKLEFEVIKLIQVH
jgi:subtilisin family serine protease